MGKGNKNRLRHLCPLCPNRVGAHSDALDRIASSRLYYHVISQHPHLVFRCGFGRSDDLNSNGKSIKSKCGKMYQYYLTYDELKKHLDKYHSFERVPSAKSSYQRILEVLSAIFAELKCY